MNECKPLVTGQAEVDSDEFGCSIRANVGRAAPSARSLTPYTHSPIMGTCPPYNGHLIPYNEHLTPL